MHNRLLIVVMGAPGVGKSTLAGRLAARIPAMLLNSDDITEPLFGDDRDSAEYLRRRLQLYAALYRLAEVNLGLGHSVIVDAPNGDLIKLETERAGLMAIADRAGARLCVLRCRLDPEAQRRRLLERAAPRDARKLADWPGWTAADPHMADGLPLPHLALNMANPIESNVEHVLAFLLARP